MMKLVKTARKQATGGKKAGNHVTIEKREKITDWEGAKRIQLMLSACKDRRP